MATSPFHKLKSATPFTPTLLLSTHLNPHRYHTSSATFLLSHLPSSLPSATQSSYPTYSTAAHSKKNSAPGPDGIPYCLYAWCPLLQALLVKVIQASISTGQFPVLWSHTLICPILKPGKNAFLPASYHPIALFCTNYKIFTMILSSCMKSFLPDLFPEHQTGYISSWSTHHAALRFAHLLNTTKETTAYHSISKYSLECRGTP